MTTTNTVSTKLIQSANDLAKWNLYDQNYDFKNLEILWSKEDREEQLNNFDLSKQPEYIQDKVKEDFKLMESIQENRNDFTVPRVGDYFVNENNELQRLCISLSNYGEDFKHIFQVGSLYGSYHISKGGFSSYSGGCDERVDLTNSKLIGEKPASFWMWHEGRSGAHRGIQITINVKIWK